jgi:DNA repair protein RadD
MSSLWPHQAAGLQETFSAIEAGKTRIGFTSPTGGGKSRCMFEMMRYAEKREWPVALYATRNMLIEQLCETMDSYGIQYGVRAAELPEMENLNAAVQVASIKTEDQRVFKKKQRSLHHAKLVLWDEAHMQKAGVAQKIFKTHEEQGAINIGLTATPLGISHMYEDLIVAGTNRELRDCGAHLPCEVYAPDEPDMSQVRRSKTGEFVIEQRKYEIWTQSIVGRVIDYYNTLNPNRLPTLLFAPGVKESMWFVNQLEEAGIRAAHIDGNNVYRDGREYKSSRKQRRKAVDDLRAGSLDIVCNRFVLREGIDIPELFHCILATPIGSLLSYIQTVGRVLRNHESLDRVIIQDHGGNFWRHGSPNANRDWRQLWKISEKAASSLRMEQLREQKEPEPIVCPACGAVRMTGAVCVSCDFQHTKSVRMVVQENGELREQSGRIMKPRNRVKRNDTEQKWIRVYHRMKKAGMNFNQAEALFFRENFYWPTRDLPFMPKDDYDRHKLVKDVPTELLN